MNIVCATLNSKYIHSALSSWCIRAGIESFCEEKHNVLVVESTINSDLSTFVSEIIDKKPDVIAFSCSDTIFAVGQNQSETLGVRRRMCNIVRYPAVLPMES